MVQKKIKQVLALLMLPILLCGMLPLSVPAADIAELEEENFTLLWTTDPQWYSFKYFDIIEQQTAWVAENYERLDIRYTIHTGDFVDNPHSTEQWSLMTQAYACWDEAGLPYGVLAGNHDVDGSDHTEFSAYFGKARYENNAWYGGDYDDNFGHYDLMTIDGVDFIFVYLGYNSSYSQEDYDWLNSVLAQHSDRIAFLSFHEYLAATGERTANGEKFFQNVVLKNPNVRMVLCGHNYNSTRKVEEIDDNGDGKADRTLYQLMANYQNTTNGGNGFMRFMECDIADGVIVSRTYSPYTETYGSDYEDGTVIDEYGYRDEFTIPFDFSAPTPKNEGDPESGTVVVTSKVIFATTQDSAAVALTPAYQNTAESGGIYRSAGIYDRHFSLNAADAFTDPTAVNYVVAEYIEGDGYRITQTIEGDILGYDPMVPIPQNGIVIVLPKDAVNENGVLIDMDTLTVGRKVILSKAQDITTPSAMRTVTVEVPLWDGAYSISGINRLTGNDDWVMYDSLLDDSAAYTHEWDMLFSFTPVNGETDRYTLTAADTTLGKEKKLAIPENGFVLAINTYSGEEALRTSLRKYFTEGLTVTLTGYVPGAGMSYTAQSVLPEIISDWTYDSTLMQVVEEDGAQVFYNTNGQWPAADYNLAQSITFDPAETALYYDFTLNTNAKLNLILFFNNSNTTEHTSGEYLSIQSYFHDVTISSGSGDVKGDGTAKRDTVDLSTVDFPDGCYNDDGTLTLNAVRVFASGSADAKLYMRSLGLTTNVYDVSDTAVSQTITLLDPLTIAVPGELSGGGYIYNNGVLTVTADTDDGYEIVMEPYDTIDVSSLQNWLIDVTSTALFDIKLTVTTAAADASYGFVSDFYPVLCGTLESGAISAGVYEKALNLYDCYVWNNIQPTDGLSTVKRVTISLKSAGTLTIGALQLSNTDKAGSFADDRKIAGGLTALFFETAYPVTDGILSGMSAGTTVEMLLANITSRYTVAVYENGSTTDGAAAAKTGQTMQVTDGTWLLCSCKIAVIGDVDGDGAQTSADARSAIRAALGDTLTAEQLLAADVDGSGVINSSDARMMLAAVVA